MGYEQPNLDFLTEADKADFKKQEKKTEYEKSIKKEDLEFNCEHCGDSGCRDCNWGRKKNDF